MFTLGASSPKKCARDPRALFSVSRSSSFTGFWFSRNHSAKPVTTLVLPTPPLPPMERMTRLFIFLAPSLPRRTLEPAVHTVLDTFRDAQRPPGSFVLLPFADEQKDARLAYEKAVNSI